ncbi:MAG TPA: hypothetical protein VF424_14520 [Vicinamibacterales bacterium]
MAGLIGAALLSRYVRALLFEISPTDVTAYAGATAVLLAAAIVAVYLAARRATRVDPIATLR